MRSHAVRPPNLKPSEERTDRDYSIYGDNNVVDGLPALGKYEKRSYTRCGYGFEVLLVECTLLVRMCRTRDCESVKPFLFSSIGSWNLGEAALRAGKLRLQHISMSVLCLSPLIVTR
jgi:hypothetical protein